MDINQDNFPMWIRCLGMLLSKVEQCVNAVDGLKKTVPRDVSTLQHINQCAEILQAVSNLLRVDAIQKIITSGQFLALLTQRRSLS